MRDVICTVRDVIHRTRITAQYVWSVRQCDNVTMTGGTFRSHITYNVYNGYMRTCNRFLEMILIMPV